MNKKITVIAVTYFFLFFFFQTTSPTEKPSTVLFLTHWCFFSSKNHGKCSEENNTSLYSRRNNKKGPQCPKAYLNSCWILINVTRIPWLPCYTTARKIKWKCYGITSTEQPTPYYLRENIKHGSRLNKNCSVLRKQCIDITQQEWRDTVRGGYFCGFHSLVQICLYLD